MSLRINNNVAALNGYRNLSATNVQLGKSLEKLSSGFRINRAADDAAGLVKSESLRAEINGTKGAIKNAQDGVSFVQTAEGALNEVHSILQRMRELAVDAANTATTDGAAQQEEVEELMSELTSIGSRTKFAGSTVFTDNDLTFQTGANAGDTLSITTNLSIDLDGRPRLVGQRLDHEDRRSHLGSVGRSFGAGCQAEPPRAHHQQPERRSREPHGLRVPDP